MSHSLLLLLGRLAVGVAVFLVGGGGSVFSRLFVVDVVVVAVVAGVPVIGAVIVCFVLLFD